MSNRLTNLYNNLFSPLDTFQSLALFVARMYVAWVFFKSGLTKINDWESTLLLFEYEYSVPYISHVYAAYMATVGELILPVMLALGLLARFSAIGIFIINLVAVISLEDMPAAALNLHYIWGMCCAMVAFWGAGIVSIDHRSGIE